MPAVAVVQRFLTSLFHYYCVGLGYKSIERRDYSIDLKTEYIFRQFTASTPPRHSLAQQQSIKEEQENEVQATFV